jgi:hypothetical protein
MDAEKTSVLNDLKQERSVTKDITAKFETGRSQQYPNAQD